VTDPVRIGWREWVDLPDWGVTLKAKIDTGAKSSSLDVTRIEHITPTRVRFDIHRSRKKTNLVTVEADIHKETRVRSSNGQMQERIVVRTRMILGGVEKEILVTLTSRRKMLHRMLLGREALRDDFLIEAGTDHLATPKRANATTIRS
jgi:hypothetical protein